MNAAHDPVECPICREAARDNSLAWWRWLLLTLWIASASAVVWVAGRDWGMW